MQHSMVHWHLSRNKFLWNEKTKTKTNKLFYSWIWFSMNGECQKQSPFCFSCCPLILFFIQSHFVSDVWTGLYLCRSDVHCVKSLTVCFQQLHTSNASLNSLCIIAMQYLCNQDSTRSLWPLWAERMRLVDLPHSSLNILVKHNHYLYFQEVWCSLYLKGRRNWTPVILFVWASLDITTTYAMIQQKERYEKVATACLWSFTLLLKLTISTHFVSYFSKCSSSSQSQVCYTSSVFPQQGCLCIYHRCCQRGFMGEK